MTTEEVSAIIPVLIALRDESVDMGFEPTGNIERAHHLADMLEDWFDAFCLNRTIEVCHRWVEVTHASGEEGS